MSIEKEIIEKLVKEKAKERKDLERIKKSVAKKYKSSFPTNATLLKQYHKIKGKDKDILSLLRTRPVRSLSGVVNISVLTKPFPCPGQCIYCPEEKEMPKSYLKGEPAVMRALKNKYHPEKQVKTRLKALQKTGHPTGKIELRIVGGTWSFYPDKYKHLFIKKCFDACNGKPSKTLKEAQKRNERAKHRIVCLSVETRPDFITAKEIKKLREWGITMVEMGIQSLSDKVLSYIKRGHSRKEVIKATRLLKNSGFKVCYQMMLNLPGSSPKEDIASFKELFQNPDFRPDFLKIYPCLVIRNTPLFSLFKEGKYLVYSNEELAKIIISIKKEIIPSYVRIQRLFRDIPIENIEGGCKISNLREVIAKDGQEKNWQCQCIRCKEVKEDYNFTEKLYLFRKNYQASGEKESFLTIENKKRTKLYALLRLRDLNNSSLPCLKDSVIIREIRTYGRQLPLEEKSTKAPQHQGMGKKLVKKAEEIAKKEFRKKKIFVISGVGVRNYWRQKGYRLRKTYMIKKL